MNRSNTGPGLGLGYSSEAWGDHSEMVSALTIFYWPAALGLAPVGQIFVG